MIWLVKLSGPLVTAGPSGHERGLTRQQNVRIAHMTTNLISYRARDPMPLALLRDRPGVPLPWGTDHPDNRVRTEEGQKKPTRSRGQDGFSGDSEKPRMPWGGTVAGALGLGPRSLPFGLEVMAGTAHGLSVVRGI